MYTHFNNKLSFQPYAMPSVTVNTQIINEYKQDIGDKMSKEIHNNDLKRSASW